MKLLLALIMLAVSLGATAQHANVVTLNEATSRVGGNEPNDIAIIPEPVTLVRKNGYFHLPPKIVIEALASAELKQSVSFLKDRLSIPTGYSVITTSSTSPKANIKLVLTKKTVANIGSEGYQLQITPKLITITANKPAGIFYGAQTLIQLLPKEIESKQKIKSAEWKLPCADITDYPRFEWRGLLLDVARHFFTKEEVKQYIDGMVRYKYNILHLHLTDDEGWRIEIKGYPKLTETGAWNVKREGDFGTFKPIKDDEPRDYGGFYTQEDLKELVAYAKERFVNIIPEIDAPGHSMAAVASYPELSCTADAVNYKVSSGSKMINWVGATPIALVDNTLCPANENVYEFLDTVVAQVARIFPFEYIHMGGDEAPYNFWEKSPEVTEMMKRENLKTMAEVQGYFERRVEKIVSKHGKRFMAWDEVLEGGVTPSAAVMSWRNIKYGIEASNNKHKVVMAPTEYTYLDYMQGDEVAEPKVFRSLRLNKVYEYDPLPEGADPNYIMGAQGNVWTAQVYNIRTVQYMTWPRGFAIAESLWSPSGRKNWKNFFSRTEQHFGRLDIAEIKYAPSVYDPIFNVKRTHEDRLSVTLNTEIEGLDIYYSFDNSFPDRFYPKYKGPLLVPIDAGVLRVITYRGNKPIGRMINMPIEELNKRAPKE
ncbi:beta-N-acetylhexosaminidase [Sphingobacterium spiritivorum]|uniref:beta-N-acetylhexosaminidase n=1 Tax=Sphingobacterium spiritivorum TaxID=258 RepID=UPI003DA1E0E3